MKFRDMCDLQQCQWKADTPPYRRPPLLADPPLSRSPPGRPPPPPYGQPADGTHPTGMQTCLAGSGLSVAEAELVFRQFPRCEGSFYFILILLKTASKLKNWT